MRLSTFCLVGLGISLHGCGGSAGTTDASVGRDALDEADSGTPEPTMLPETAQRPMMLLVPAGTFTMGSPEDEPSRRDSEMEHEVTISRALYVARTEVTQGQYEAVMGSNPSEFTSCGTDWT